MLNVLFFTMFNCLLLHFPLFVKSYFFSKLLMLKINICNNLSLPYFIVLCNCSFQLQCIVLFLNGCTVICVKPQNKYPDLCKKIRSDLINVELCLVNLSSNVDNMQILEVFVSQIF